MNLDQIIAAIRNCLVDMQNADCYTADAKSFFHTLGEGILAALKHNQHNSVRNIIQQGWDKNVDYMDELLDRIYLALNVFSADEFNELLSTALSH